MAAETGIDIVVGLQDRATAQLQETITRIRSISQRADGLSIDNAGNISQQAGRGGLFGGLRSLNAQSEALPTGLVKGIGAVAIGQAVDSLLEGAIAAIRDSRSASEIGVALTETFAKSLRNVPIAGPLGELLARGLGAAFGGGFQSFEERQAELDKERQEALARGAAEDFRRHRDEQRAQEAAVKEAELQAIADREALDHELFEERNEMLRQQAEDARLFDEQKAAEAHEAWLEEIEGIRAHNEEMRRFDEQKDAEARAQRARDLDVERARADQQAATRLAPTLPSRSLLGLSAIFQSREGARADAALQTARAAADIRNILSDIRAALPQTVELVN